jgi:hypothetical protein
MFDVGDSVKLLETALVNPLIKDMLRGKVGVIVDRDPYRDYVVKFEGNARLFSLETHDLEKS